MLEWYRANETYETLMEDSRALVAEAARTAGTSRFSFRGRDCDPFAEPERLTVAEAFRNFAGIDLMTTVTATDPDRAALAAASTPQVCGWPTMTHGATFSAA